MGNIKGLKRDERAMCALEQRRRDAAVLLRQGLNQAEVARRTGVSEMSVSRWAKLLKKKGVIGLRSAGRTGRKPRLNEQQCVKIKRALLEGPEAHGFSNALWTLPRVADVIRDTCGITYHPGHVWKVLRNLGWSCQRPASKAMERDEESVRRWKRYTWPALKKKPCGSGAPSYS